MLSHRACSANYQFAAMQATNQLTSKLNFKQKKKKKSATIFSYSILPGGGAAVSHVLKQKAEQSC